MRMDLVWSDEVTEQLTKLADLDSIAPEMLKSAAPIAVDALKQQVGKHKSSRANKHLSDSVRAGKPKKRKRGGYGLDVSFSGYDSGHGSSPNYPTRCTDAESCGPRVRHRQRARAAVFEPRRKQLRGCC